MKVFGKIGACRYGMYVDVEYTGPVIKMLQTGFFPDLTQCHIQYVLVAIGMSAGLQPFVQLGVMGE